MPRRVRITRARIIATGSSVSYRTVNDHTQLRATTTTLIPEDPWGMQHAFVDRAESPQDFAARSDKSGSAATLVDHRPPGARGLVA